MNACFCVLPQSLFLSDANFLFLGETEKTFPFLLFGAIERKIGKVSRQFLDDSLLLVAVALRQEVFFTS